MSALWYTLLQLFKVLGQLILELGQLAGDHALLLFFLAWCLWGINWQKAWPVLARGAWAPLGLLLITVALAWSQLLPSACDCLAIVTVPNFWWQLGAVGLFAAIALFCGWLQGVFGWAPPEIQLEPAGLVHGPFHEHRLEHNHAHGHGPEHGESSSESADHP